MKIVCISGSNVELARGRSASGRACELVAEIAESLTPGKNEVVILPLLDYELKSCRMCGKCLELGECALDEAFNEVYRQMISADVVFLVCPHYAPFPSRVMVLTEKLEEMAYLNWCADPDYQFPLKNKPIGLIVHGGQTEQALPYYKTALLDPLAGVFNSLQMRVVGANEKWPNGEAFGIEHLWKPDDSIFVTIEHDWEGIKARLEPLVYKVLETAG